MANIYINDDIGPDGELVNSTVATITYKGKCSTTNLGLEIDRATAAMDRFAKSARPFIRYPGNRHDRRKAASLARKR